jgi:antitoxin component of RelBE/YafQ-DinJ toxin-antitoxin module
MKTVLHLKIDREVKMNAQKAAAKLGLPLSLVVGEQLRHFVAAERITFAAPLKPSRKLARELRRAEADIKAGRNLSPVFHSAAEMDAYLDAL